MSVSTVSTERTCTTPASSEDSGVFSFKLKRRWIEMSSSGETEDELDSPLDLSIKKDTRPDMRFKKPKRMTGEEKTVHLPNDPRDWTKQHVLAWLRYMSSVYDISTDGSKFDMNGKALCLMNMQMFVRRVPLGGKMLYKDFRLRLHSATFASRSAPAPAPSRCHPAMAPFGKMMPLKMLMATNRLLH